MPKLVNKVVLFDGNAILHRAFHALPPLSLKDGTLVNAVYGFVTIFLKVLKDIRPSHVAVTFDRREPTFRHKEYVAYKAQRVKQPQELYDQIPLIKEVLSAFNVPVYELAGYEADDIIGTVVTKVRQSESDMDILIVTGDLDTLQLVDDKTKVFTPKKGLSDPVIYDVAAVNERYGLTPNQLIDYKALRGDPSDNIPGVKGVGEKTASDLIKTYGTLENLLDVLADPKKFHGQLSPRLMELIRNNREEALMSKHLVTIIKDAPVDFNLVDSELKSFNTDKLVELFNKFEFKSLLARIPEVEKSLALPVVASEPKKADKIKTDYKSVVTEVDLVKMLKQIKSTEFLAVDTETTGLNPWQAKLLGISLSTKPGEGFFVVVDDKIKTTTAWQEFVQLLIDNNIKKSGHNIKFDYKILKLSGLDLKPISFDTLLAAYLLKGGERTLDLKSLVFEELGQRMTNIEELIGPKGVGQKTMADVELNKLSDYACADADFTGRLQAKLAPRLQESDLQGLFTKIEMPLVEVLSDMELNGIKIDSGYLNKMAKTLRTEIADLTDKIYKLSGEEFNINSPKQLKEILFVKLKIGTEGLRKTKTGISTAASELEKMRGLHPIIDEIFEYRELSKLLSTYVEALPALVNKTTGRVHTSFNQTITATGRLSSSDPNLQNIPIRTDWGKKIRQAFVAESGNVLVSADYSQIELRVAAHLSGDKTMIEVFKSGRDFHAATAAFIHDVPLDKVTPDQRRSAKEVNFGVLYGMGAWGLSERTGLTRYEAQEFISRYFKSFSGLAKWIEDIKQQTKKDGYATTWFGRRRYIPEINSGVAQVRAQAERMAVNLPVQGTAADLLKVAMINLFKDLAGVSSKTEMLLQVHDELVFEVPKKEVPKVAAFIKQVMEKVDGFNVPIVVDIKTGDNWGEMEKLEVK